MKRYTIQLKTGLGNILELPITQKQVEIIEMDGIDEFCKNTPDLFESLETKMKVYRLAFNDQKDYYQFEWTDWDFGLVYFFRYLPTADMEYVRFSQIKVLEYVPQTLIEL